MLLLVLEFESVESKYCFFYGVLSILFLGRVELCFSLSKFIVSVLKMRNFLL